VFYLKRQYWDVNGAERQQIHYTLYDDDINILVVL